MILRSIYGYVFLFFTIIFTVFSQLIMRWQVGLAGELPADAPGKFRFIANLLINPWVITGILATFGAGVSWMLTMTKLELSYAYPFISLNFIIVFLASALLFHESVSTAKIVGTLIVMCGLAVISQG